MDGLDLGRRCLRCCDSPPQILLFTVNPEITYGFGYFQTDVEPARRHSACGWAASGGPRDLQTQVDIALTVAGEKKGPESNVLNGRNRASLKTLGPKVVLSAEVRDDDVQLLIS